MTLPKLNIPTFDILVPSTNKTIKCRPYLVGENVILLTALESDSVKEMTDAIKRIVNNCVVEWNGCSIEKLAIFDLEFLFLKIRAKAKGEKIRIKFNPVENSECEACKKSRIVDIDIDKLEVCRTAGHTNKIKLADSFTLEMQYPKYDIIGTILTRDPGKVSEITVLFDLIKSCLVNIYDVDSVYEIKDATDEELDKFLESLTEEQFEMIMKFFETMPRVQYIVDLSCNLCGRKDVQTITGLQSFFE